MKTINYVIEKIFRDEEVIIRVKFYNLYSCFDVCFDSEGVDDSGNKYFYKDFSIDIADFEEQIYQVKEDIIKFINEIKREIEEYNSKFLEISKQLNNYFEFNKFNEIDYNYSEE